MITINYNEEQVSSSDFLQASFELIFDHILNDYVRKFVGQINCSKSIEIYDFINNNANNLLTIRNIDKNISLDDCKLSFLYLDTISDICRLEFKQIKQII